MPIPQSPFGQDRQGSRHYADTKRCCAREATPKRSSDRRGESPPLQGRPVRRQDVDAGAKLAPQRKSEDLYYRSFCCECMCSGERFPGCTRQRRGFCRSFVPLISDWRSAYFVYRVHLKTANTPGQRAFSRCAAPFSLAIHKVFLRKNGWPNTKIPRCRSHFQFSDSLWGTLLWSEVPWGQSAPVRAGIGGFLHFCKLRSDAPVRIRRKHPR